MTRSDDSMSVEQLSCPSTSPRVVSTVKVAHSLKDIPTLTSALPSPIPARKTLSQTPEVVTVKTTSLRGSSKIPKRVPLKKKTETYRPPLIVTSGRSPRPHSVTRSSPLRKEVSLFELAFANELASFQDLRVFTTVAVTPVVTISPTTPIDSERPLQSSVGRSFLSNLSLRSISRSLRSNKPNSSLMRRTNDYEHLKSSFEDCIHELLPTLSSRLPIDASQRDPPSKKLILLVRSYSQSLSGLISKRLVRPSKEEYQEDMWMAACEKKFVLTKS